MNSDHLNTLPVLEQSPIPWELLESKYLSPFIDSKRDILLLRSGNQMPKTLRILDSKPQRLTSASLSRYKLIEQLPRSS